MKQQYWAISFPPRISPRKKDGIFLVPPPIQGKGNILLSHLLIDMTLTIFILALHEIGEQLHEARELWGIGEHCPCKRQSIEDSARIKELPDEENDLIVDVVGENTPLLQEGMFCIFEFYH